MSLILRTWSAASRISGRRVNAGWTKEFQSAPPARGATHWATYVVFTNAFQSAPPARGATPRTWAAPTRKHCFNPRPPRGGRHEAAADARVVSVSIRAPPRGGRLPRRLALPQTCPFQSAPPARGATMGRWLGDPVYRFNPRPPRGGRPSKVNGMTGDIPFQSAPPARGATYSRPTPTGGTCRFNPRPPRGGRPGQLSGPSAMLGFNPRPPRGGRLAHLRPLLVGHRVSIRAPRAGGDRHHVAGTLITIKFQSAPPARGATLPREQRQSVL